MPSHQQQRSQEQSQAPAQTRNKPSSRPTQPPKREGLLGWFKDTGDWAADKYDSVSDSVSEWSSDVYDSAAGVVESVSETISDTKDSVVETIVEAKEAIDSTSISRKNGVWTLNTDLDEIADILPFGIMDLDKDTGENQVSMQVDRNKGEVKITSSSLAISGMNVSGLKLDSAVLQNVEIIIKNAQINLPLLGKVSVGSSESNARKSARISIGSVIGSNAVYDDGNEVIKASQIELLNLLIETEMGGESFGMQPQNAKFSVGEAKIVGLESDALSGNLSASDASASLDPTTKSAQFAAASVLGSNLSRDGLGIESTEIQALQGNIASGANGQVANVSAKQALISGVDIGESTEEGSESTLALNLSIDEARINDLDSEHVDADQLNFSDFQLSESQDELAISASKASASNFDSSVFDAKSLELNDAHYSQNEDGFNTGSRQASASGFAADRVDAATLELENFNVNKDNSGFGIDASSAKASGLDVEGFGSASSASLRELDTNIGTDGSSNLNLAEISAAGLTSHGHTLGNLSGSAIQAQAKSNGDTDANIGGLAFQNYQSDLGSSASGSINNIQASGNTNSLEGKASVGNANLGKTNILGQSIQSANASELRVNNKNGQQTANLGSLSAQGFQNDYASVNGIQGNDLSLKRSDQGQQIAGSLDKLQLDSAAGMGSQAEQITFNKLSGDSDSSFTNAGFAIENINMQNASNDIGALETLNLNAIESRKEGSNVDASLAGMEMLNSSLVGVGSTDSLVANDLSLHSDGTTHQANMASMTAKSIQDENFGANVEEATLNSVDFSGTGLQDFNASLQSGEIKNAAIQKAHLEHGSISNGQFAIQNGQAEASLEAIDFQKAGYSNMAFADSGQARDIKASGDLDQQRGSIGSMGINGASANMPQLRGSLDSASLQDASFHHTGDTHGTASIGSAEANKAVFEAQHAGTTGQSFNENSAPVNLDIDANRLIETGSKRIDSANIKASANMIAGEYGEGLSSFAVDPNTNLSTDLAVRNNQLQNGSKIESSRSIDTALWTSTDGAYVEDDNLMADVNGWFDINAGKRANKEMGLQGKELHSLGAYGNAVANAPQSKSENAIGNPIDLSTAKVDGNVALSDGLLDAGGISGQLSGANEGANQIDFNTNANRISLAFAKLLSTSLAVSTDQGNATAGTAAIEKGDISLEPTDGTASGSVERVSVEGINLSH